MAEINKKLVKYATEAKFEEHLTGLADKINPKSVVFIEDTGRIWTHGKYYDGAWAGISGKPTTFAPSAHTHGSITNDGKIGTQTNRIIETTTGGALTHVAKNTAYNRAFGTGENQVARGNHTHSNFTRTAAGFTPAPTTNTTTRYLREDGTWVVPPNTNTTYTTGTLAQLNAGNDTTGRLQTAKLLNDWLNPKLGNKLDKKGGVLETYTEKLFTYNITSSSAPDIDLTKSNTYYFDLKAQANLFFTNVKSGAHSFTLIFKLGAGGSVGWPASVKWESDEVPVMSNVGKTYIITFLTVDSGTTWFGMRGGVF